MDYKLTAFEDNEKDFIYRMEGEKAERHGAIGYMRLDFGKGGKEFWTTWFDSQKHLKTPAFKAEFDSVINFLRSGMEYPIFSNRRELRIFYLGHSDWQVIDRVVGFKIQTADYTYFARCRPSTDDYDVYVFAYDNRLLLPELAGKHELPEKCYSIKPHSGELVSIYRGENGYIPCDISKPTPEENRLFADTSNKIFGNTRAQEEAMLAGCMFGWNTTAAKPWNYDQNGNFKQPQQNKNEHER